MNTTKHVIWISAVAAVVLFAAAPGRAQEPVRVAENPLYPLYRGAVAETTGGPTGISPIVPAVNANSFRFEVCYYYPDRDRSRHGYRYRNRDWGGRYDDRYFNRYDGYRYDYRYDSRRNWDNRYRPEWYGRYCFPAFSR